MKIISTFIAILLTTSLFAAEKDGISFADKISLNGKELVLNGIGIRKATIFKVKVYYGGLYLEQKTQTPASFLTTPAPKQRVMNFVHEVEAKKLAKGFIDGLEAANKNFQVFAKSMEKFNASLEDVNKGDKIIITFLADGVLVNIKNKDKEKIVDAEFSQALLNIWFINPADEGLSNGLLGVK
jgi:hypothetical protein